MARKMITIEKGEYSNFFTIYEVKAVTHNEETEVYCRYLNKKDAEDGVKFVEEFLKERYRIAYIMEQLVFC